VTVTALLCDDDSVAGIRANANGIYSLYQHFHVPEGVVYTSPPLHHALHNIAQKVGIPLSFCVHLRSADSTALHRRPLRMRAGGASGRVPLGTNVDKSAVGL
jgi:hypothetical protein